jgi:hypothetical protein
VRFQDELLTALANTTGTSPGLLSAVDDNDRWPRQPFIDAVRPSRNAHSAA